jgi:hypothetical protein
MNAAVQKFLDDLILLEFAPEYEKASNGQEFAIIKDYQIELGRFAGRIIDLGLPALPDYPRMVGQAIHVKSEPLLLDRADSVSGVRNIIKSPLGVEWRYWSFRFNAFPEETARHLMIQINGIFKRI